MHQDALQSGTSLWLALGAPPIDCPRLEHDTVAEVAIIGGGITGALVGYFLAKFGVDCVILDREAMGAGSTSASTGLLQYEVDTPLSELIPKVGEAHAVQAYRRGLRAIDELDALIHDLQQPCGFYRRQTLCLASSPADAGPLLQEYECRRHFGFDVHHFETAPLAELFSVKAPSGVLSSGDGELDPYRFTQILLRAGQSAGLRLFHHTPVQRIDETPLGATVVTERGKVTARAVMICTGYAAGELLGATPGDLNTTYALASHPIAGIAPWPDRRLVWETARPYFYARQTEDARIIIGGEDTPGAFDHQNDALLQEKAAALVLRAKQVFPPIDFEPAYVWAGTFGETKDGLPYIGLLPGRESVYAALGYGGNGITFGMIAARLLADLFLQRSNEDAAVFRFGR